MEGLHSVNYIITKILRLFKIKLNAIIYLKKLTYKLIDGKIITEVKLIDIGTIRYTN